VALTVAGLAGGFREGAHAAAAVIDDGRAARLLDVLRDGS
jgi:anthranilate phosphoribosyltransferase